ncbi:MAG TPA: hypothetical protein VII11_09065 [Bacteroidota bacterium]
MMIVKLRQHRRMKRNTILGLFLLPLWSVVLGIACSNASDSPPPPEPFTEEIPPALFASGIAYDHARNAFVVFGGQSSDGSTNSSTTYEWDRTTWIRKNIQGPSARYWTSMAYDQSRGRIVLFGGTRASAIGDTWEYDGTTWRSIAVSGPGARFAHEVTYDTRRGVALLFGGSTGPARLNDLWSWNGTQWQMLSNGQGPTGRAAFGMAYDTSRGELVVFGGFSAFGSQGVTQHGDTWVWDGIQWSLKNAQTSELTARDHVSMAYDAARQRVVLFGGNVVTNNVFQEQKDTWEWDGQEWTLKNSNGPTIQSGHRILYHPQLRRVVLWTGTNSTPPSAIWAWNGTQWQLVE